MTLVKMMNNYKFIVVNELQLTKKCEILKFSQNLPFLRFDIILIS